MKEINNQVEKITEAMISGDLREFDAAQVKGLVYLTRRSFSSHVLNDEPLNFFGALYNLKKDKRFRFIETKGDLTRVFPNIIYVQVRDCAENDDLKHPDLLKILEDYSFPEPTDTSHFLDRGDLRFLRDYQLQFQRENYGFCEAIVGYTRNLGEKPKLFWKGKELTLDSKK
jgi:hypothetical protein